ncbi:MAG TPA: DUF427 domain-containing protein [Alphaproteobacteria bacterium]|nr:DUF427 domain-containing protein [Alphaproteobacteria bacterium]
MQQTIDIPAGVPERVSHAGYRVVIEPSATRVRAVFNGETIADSDRALVMRETRLRWVYYFPRADVRMDLLTRKPQRTHCPFKGDASYWSLAVGDRVAEDAVWSYEDPFDEAMSVRDYVAFNWKVVDSWYQGEDRITEQPVDAASAKANPYVDWLVEDAWKATSAENLVHRFANALSEGGFPLWRLRLLVRTLNPLLMGRGYSWTRGVDGVEEWEATYEAVQGAQFQDSPFAAILKGEGGIRRRLEGSDPLLDYPVLEDLVQEGATDYVVMPLRFSDGQVNIISMVSDRPGGFSTDELGPLYEILPNLARQLEVHAQRTTSTTLLQTYLGRNAGTRVMDGLIKRGDGEDLHAVVWYSDLRGSTGLAETLSREDYLDGLNGYFDSVAGAVIEHGGEVLKFIGDAVLAIFAIDDPESPNPEACARALDAVRDAAERMAVVNTERAARGQPVLRFGTSLHRGDLTYGNIGTMKRLDFTVIGPAVNEAARIEALCKTLDTPVLISEAFAKSIDGRLEPLGLHALRGVRAEQAIFTLPPVEVEVAAV